MSKDEITIKQQLFEKLLQDVYLPLIKDALANNDEKQDKYLEKLSAKYHDLLQTYKIDTKDNIVSAIVNFYNNESEILNFTSFRRQAIFIKNLIKNEIIPKDAIFLQDLEDFMWKLSREDDDYCIKSWTDDMQLQNISITKWKLYQLPFLLTIKPDNYYKICLDICSHDCDCLVSQVSRIIDYDKNNTITFKKYCHGIYDYTYLHFTSYNLNKYSGLLKELRKYISKRKRRLEVLVDESLYCFPRELTQMCVYYVRI